MSHPGEPSDTSANEPAGIAATELSPDDFERLSSSFRPSWQLDDAPFTGPSSLSTADIRALQGTDARAEVRALVQATNGSHAPPKANVVVQPAESVIVEPTPPPAASRPMPVPVAVSLPTPGQAAPVRRVAVAIPRARPRLASLELDGVVPSFARRSRKPLWIGLAGAAVAAAAIGVWATSSGTTTASPSPAVHNEPVTSGAGQPAEPVATQAAEPPPAPAPPPPPATVAASPPAASPPITMRAAAATPPPPAANAMPPITMRPAAPVAAPPPRAPAPAPAQPPKAVPRPKAAPTTIVRDVPF